MDEREPIYIIWLCLVLFSPTQCFAGTPDGDVGKRAAQLIACKGYPVESHIVTTNDSYVITMQRIPAGRKELPGDCKRRKPVVFLMSGLQGSSADYVVNLPHQSLAFILADHGFDVWLGNLRGCGYSKHLRFSKKKRKFWNFSIDEMVRYDLPAQINYVLDKTGQRALQYVGWSLGCSVMFGLLADEPQYNKKIQLFHAMAPAPFVRHMKSAIRLLVPFSKPLLALAQFVFKGSMGTKNDKLFHRMKTTTCRGDFPRASCLTCFYLINGGLPVEVNMTRIPVYLSNAPSGTSVRTLGHFAQLAKCERFQKYDWGPIKNLRMYGQRRPAEYDLGQVRAPVAIYWGDGDVLTVPRDIAELAKRLPNVVLKYKVPVPGFTHFDFGWSCKAWKHVYKKILQMAKAYAQT